jgi:hypothetical protein
LAESGFADLTTQDTVRFMKKVGESLEFSATDLVGYLNCRHLVDLDRAVAEGTLPKPKVWDPLLEILSERGAAHEQNSIEHLTKSGLEVADQPGPEIFAHASNLADDLEEARSIRGTYQHTQRKARSDCGRTDYG